MVKSNIPTTMTKATVNGNFLHWEVEQLQLRAEREIFADLYSMQIECALFFSSSHIRDPIEHAYCSRQQAAVAHTREHTLRSVRVVIYEIFISIREAYANVYAWDKTSQLVIHFFVCLESVIYRQRNEMNINWEGNGRTEKEREREDEGREGEKKEMIRVAYT